MGIKVLFMEMFLNIFSSKNKFDLIVCQDFIEHLNHEQLTSIFSLIKDSLKDKGFILLHTINSDSPFFGKILYGDITRKLLTEHQLVILNYIILKLLKLQKKIVIHGKRVC